MTRNESSDRIPVVRLADIPIENPSHEKQVLDKGDDARKLNPDYFSGPVLVDDETKRARIIEVYRRCFDGAYRNEAKQIVIRDFAANFPDLVLYAEWLREWIKKQSVLPAQMGGRKREILKALSNGLRSAATDKKREPAIQKNYRVHAARIALRTIQEELSTWNRTLNRSDSAPRYIADCAAQKAEELIHTYRKLGQRYERRLNDLLQKAHLYKAAILITSKTFRIRPRDLQSRID